MGIASPPWLVYPPLISNKELKFSLLSLSSSLLPSSKRYSLVSQRFPSSFVQKKTYLVHCSQLKVQDDLDEEACELVNGSELKIGDGTDTIHAHLFNAVKNNNGAGILLLSDIFGFEDSYTKDFAYRIACNGYNVLLPDLFRGDPWSRDTDQPRDLFEQWLANQDPGRVAKDIAIASKWMVDEFTAAGYTKKLGIIGFCYGGGRVLEVLARDQNSIFGTGVSFYGTRMDSSAALNVRVPILFVTGDNDPLCPVNTVNEFHKIIGNGSKVTVFKGRGHGFVHRPASPEEDEDAEEAFVIMRNWLSDQLLGKE